MLEDPADVPSLCSSLNEQLCIKSRKLAFQKASEHMSLQRLLEIEATYPWMQLWDWALGYGVRGTKVCQQLLRLVARPVFGDRICYQCNTPIPPAISFFDHFMDVCAGELVDMKTLLTALGTICLFDLKWL